MKAEMKETEKTLEAGVKTEEKYMDEDVHMEGKDNSAGKSGSAGMKEASREKCESVEAQEKSGITEAGEADQSREEADDEKKTAKGMVSTRGGLYLRTVIGGLILYYAYSILSGMQTASGTGRIFLYVFVAVFGIAGVWIILDSLKRLFKKEYDE